MSFEKFLDWNIVIFSQLDINKQRNGPNMVDFEKEILNEAFDEEEPPTKVIYDMVSVERRA